MKPVYYECERSIALARLAYRLTHDQLDKEDANDLIHQCQPIAGWYPLETISVGSVAEAAEDLYPDADADKLASLADRACHRVWRKWEGADDVTSVAEDWAIDLIGEYAEDEGVNLRPAQPTIIQTACGRCGQDIEGSGDEWRDRGNNTHCPPYRERGEIVTPPADALHHPDAKREESA